MTTFRKHPNNVSTTLAQAYVAGGGQLVLSAGAGAAFGAAFPLTVTAAQAATYGTPLELNTVFTVAGRTGDTLTGVAAAEGSTDRNYAAGDRVDIRWTDGLAGAIEAAVNALENAVVFAFAAKTASATLLPAETLIQASAAAGAITLTLANAASCIGTEIIIYRGDGTANTITIQRGGTDQIYPNMTTIALPAGYGKFLRLVAIGGYWIPVGQNF